MSKPRKIFRTIIGVGLVILAPMLVFIGVRTWQEKHPAEVAEVEQAELAEEAKAEELEPAESESEEGFILTDADLTEKTFSVEDAMVQRGILTEEDQEIQAEFGEDAYSAVKTADELGTTAENEASLNKIEAWRIEQWKSMIPSEARWKSYSIDLKDGSETHVTSSAKDLGYVKYDITSALELAFDGDKDDEAAIGEGILERLANPFVAATWIRGTANIEYLGEKARSIKGNEFFNEFILEDRKAFAKNREEFEEVMKEDAVLEGDYTFNYSYDEIPGPGGDGLNHWVEYVGEDKDGNNVFILTEHYRDLVGSWYAWFRGTHVFYGPKDWQTRVKSVLDDRNSKRARPQFTDEADRQDSLTSFVFVGVDKNGNRLSEFWGINRCTSDWCIYGNATKKKSSGGKDVVIQDSSKKDGGQTVAAVSKQTPSGGDKKKIPAVVTPSPKPTTSPKPKPTTNPKKKDPAQSSNNKPENAIVAGTNVGENLDLFNLNVPQVWSNVVAEAQGGNQSDYTAAIEAGIWTPPGSENNNTPDPGTVQNNVVVTDNNGNDYVATVTWETDDKTGATVADYDYTEPTSDGGSQDVHVDHGEAETEAPHDVDMSNHDDAGNASHQNTADNSPEETF